MTNEEEKELRTENFRLRNDLIRAEDYLLACLTIWEEGSIEHGESVWVKDAKRWLKERRR